MTKAEWNRMARANPELADPKQGAGLIGLLDSLIPALQAAIIPGSGFHHRMFE